MTETAEQEPDVVWCAAWGEDVKQNDLVRVVKLGGAVRIKSLRKWPVPADKRGSLQADAEAPWYYGCIVEDRTGGQYHIYIQPHEAVYVALNIPSGYGPLDEQPGSAE